MGQHVHRRVCQAEGMRYDARMNTQRDDWTMVAHPRVRVQYVECDGIEVHEREMTEAEAMLFALLTKKLPASLPSS